MPDVPMQVGQSYTVPPGLKLVVKEQGVFHLFTKLTHNSWDIVEVKLRSIKAPHLAYRMFMKFAVDVKPDQGSTLYIDIKEYQQYYNLARRTIYESYSALLQSGLMRKLEKGKYQLDPYIVWSGSSKKREEAIQQWNRVNEW